MDDTSFFRDSQLDASLTLFRCFLHPKRVTFSLKEDVPLPAQPKTRHAAVTGGPASPLPGRDFIPSDQQAVG
jgi:hypothetical protein